MAATYGADLYRMPNESMADYMARLAKLRAAGVLGGGAMFDTPAASPATVAAPSDLGALSTPLGQVVMNQPRESVYQVNPYERTDEQKFKDAVQLVNYGPNPLQQAIMGLNLFGLGDYAGKASESFINEYVKDNPEAAAYARNGYGPTQDFNRDQITLPSVGNIVLGMFDGLFDKNTPEQAAAIPVRESQPSWTRPQAAPVQAVSVNPAYTPEELDAVRTLGMMDTLSQLNSGSISGGSSGYYSDSSGSYTGGSDYGGWTGVTADGSGNDWNSF